jgi:hypothetical protein
MLALDFVSSHSERSILLLGYLPTVVHVVERRPSPPRVVRTETHTTTVVQPVCSTFEEYFVVVTILHVFLC